MTACPLTFSPGLNATARVDLDRDLVDIVWRSSGGRLIHRLKSVLRGADVAVNVAQSFGSLL